MICARTLSKLTKSIEHVCMPRLTVNWRGKTAENRHRMWGLNGGALFCSNPSSSSSIQEHGAAGSTTEVKSNDSNSYPLTTVIERVASLSDPIIYSNLANFKDVSQCLFSRNIPEEKIITLFSRNPALSQYPRRNWETVLDYLIGNEVPVGVIVRMLVAVPQILDRSTAELDSSFACMRRRGFDNRAIYRILDKEPGLLAVEAIKVDRQFINLMGVFTAKDIRKLGVKCCSVLTEDWSDLEAKLSYIVHVMGVEQPQMVYSMTLTYPLKHIRLRHQLLYRAGIYKKVRPKKKVDNPHLRVIMDTPTRVLVEQVVGISMPEFFAFEKLLEHEQLAKLGLAENDDDESDGEYESKGGYFNSASK